MATDDRNPDEEDPAPERGFGGPGERGEEPIDGGLDDLPAFRVDADDDGYDAGRDDLHGGGRDGDAYPGNDSPDPGFAAFADDIDDPLADWPSPEARLEDLPEMRPAGSPATDADAAEAQGGAVPEATAAAAADNWGRETDTWGREAYPTADDGALEDDDYPEAAFFDDPAPDRTSEPVTGFMSGPDKADDADTAAPADRIDDDDPWGIGDSRADELLLPVVEEAPEPLETDGHDAAVATDARTPMEDVATPGAAAGIHDVDGDDDALVDDFLNDLDDFPEGPALDPEPTPPAREPARAPDTGSAWAAAAGTAAAAVTSGNAAAARVEGDRPVDPAPAATRTMDIAAAAPDADDATSSGPPWVMIAVIVVALALLGAGGYGVIQQRESQQAEIRELQAQLATAMAPEEAAAVREQQRRIEQENDALASELTTLEGENRALAERIGQLEAQLSERAEVAAAPQPAAAAAAGSPAPSVPAAPAKAPAAAPTPAPTGWFVNFGSYASKAIADSWAGRLEVGNGRVVVQTATASGRTLYRVRVIDLASRDTAERVATALEREHDLPRLWIGRD